MGYCPRLGVSEKLGPAHLDSLFIYAGAPDDAPVGSKQAKALAWLRKVNKECPFPLQILGRIIENYAEEAIIGNDDIANSRRGQQDRLNKALANANLRKL